MSGLAILLPVLRRPHRVEPLLKSIDEQTPDARVVFLCDEGDDAMIDAVDRSGSELHVLEKANYARKINHGVQITDEPYLFFGADDLEFHPAWYEIARDAFDDEIGVVATNDLGNDRVMAGELATHPLVARWYAESPTIDKSPGPLHEGYLHEFVDREFSEVARMRGAFVYAPDSIVEHLHPFWGKADFDPIYEQYQMRWVRGRRLYRRRLTLWKSP